MIKKVLVIDNDSSILEVMEEILDYEGFNVETTEGTDDILALLNTFQPNLLIIDYRLNGKNGDELCQQVKNNAVYCNLPVIIFSAYPQLLNSIENCGCNAILRKPFSLDDLTEMVNVLIYTSKNLSINTGINT